jgi:hypothetical protein
VNVGAEIQFTRQDAVAAPVTGQEGNFFAFKITQDIE